MPTLSIAVPEVPAFFITFPATGRNVRRTPGLPVLIQPMPEIRNGSVGLVLDPTGAAFAIQKWPVEASPEMEFPGGVGGAR